MGTSRLQGVFQAREVIGQIKRGKVKKKTIRKYSAKDIEKIRHLYCDEELSGSEISRKLGLPKSSVYHIIERLGVPRSAESAMRLYHKKKVATKDYDPTFRCKICGKRRPLSELRATGRFFPLVYCCCECDERSSCIGRILAYE